MWWNLFKCKWSPLLTLIPECLSRSGRLCLPHLSAQWNLCQHLLPHHGYRLPRSSLRLHRDEGWQFTGLTIDGKILWKWQQCPWFHADHSKPLEDQVREGRASTEIQFYNFFLPLRFISNYLASAMGFQLEYESSNVFQGMVNRFDACGGGYFSTPNETIASPSYPNNYPSNADCIYTISQPTGTVILLNFLTMDIYCPSWDTTFITSHYLEIRDGPSNVSPLLGKLCGSVIPAPIQSSQNQLRMKWGQLQIMWILKLHRYYLSDSTLMIGAAGEGFKLNTRQSEHKHQEKIEFGWHTQLWGQFGTALCLFTHLNFF